MNERLPYRDMRKLALLTREKIGHKHLLTETDRLLRISRHLISRTRELIRTQHLNGSLGRYQYNEDHENRTAEDSAFQPQRIQR
jgi:hypothetical protein